MKARCWTGLVVKPGELAAGGRKRGHVVTLDKAHLKSRRAGPPASRSKPTSPFSSARPGAPFPRPTVAPAISPARCPDFCPGLQRLFPQFRAQFPLPRAIGPRQFQPLQTRTPCGEIFPQGRFEVGRSHHPAPAQPPGVSASPPAFASTVAPSRQVGARPLSPRNRLNRVAQVPCSLPSLRFGSGVSTAR